MPDTQTMNLNGMEIFSVGTHANGDVITEGDLDHMVEAARVLPWQAPVKIQHLAEGDTEALLTPEAAPAMGWCRGLRKDGRRLLADLTQVPRKLAALIRQGGVREDQRRGVRGVRERREPVAQGLEGHHLPGGRGSAIGSLRDVEGLYSYEERGMTVRRYWGEVVPATAVEVPEPSDDGARPDDWLHSTGRALREEERHMADEVVEITPAEVGSTIVRLMREYCAAHPKTDAQTALKQVLTAEPDLARSYVQQVTGEQWGLPVSGGAEGAPTDSETLAAVERKQAKDELHQLAKDYLRRHPATPDYEAAPRAVLKAHPTVEKQAGY